MNYTDEHTRFLEYVKAVGTGPKGNYDLSAKQTKDAFELILKRAVPDEIIGAYLIGLRVKKETPEELKGAMEAIKALSLFPVAEADSVEIGYTLDGKNSYPPIMLKSAELLEDLLIHVTGDERLSPKFGYTSKDFYAHLDFSGNLIYHDRSVFAPKLSDLTTLRNNLGLRTSFNTVEKLNYLATTALVGMFHGPYFDLYPELYDNDYERLLIIQGNEGNPEVVKKAKMMLAVGDKRETLTIDPVDFGIEPITKRESRTLEQMCEMLENPDENLQKLIRLNAAIIGFAAGIFNTVGIGYNKLNEN